MSAPLPAYNELGRILVLDELFDLTFYQQLHRTSSGDTRAMLEQLIPVETRHLSFWKDFFKISDAKLDFFRRVKLRVLVWTCRLIGPNAVHLALEAIEIYGIRKYLAAWQVYRHDPLGPALREVLKDEFEHEDSIVLGAQMRRMVRPEDVRSVFLGLNDGLVEILGAVSGFFAAFSQPRLVLMAGSSVAVAGALSMAAGAYAAAGSEQEILRLEEGKAAFLGKPAARAHEEAVSPSRSAFVVGLSYLIGATLPILPILLGARTLAWPLAAAGCMVVIVSTILGFLSGQEIYKRVQTNLLLAALAVAVTYAIGVFARRVWGISV